MNAKKTLDAATSVQRSEMESSFGLRYSRLLDLPYFDPIRGHAVDPMHNLLLGTAKHTFSVWLKLGILNDDKIQIIDSRMVEYICSEIFQTVEFFCHKNLNLKLWEVYYTMIKSLPFATFLGHMFPVKVIFIR